MAPYVSPYPACAKMTGTTLTDCETSEARKLQDKNCGHGSRNSDRTCGRWYDDSGSKSNNYCWGSKGWGRRLHNQKRKDPVNYDKHTKGHSKSGYSGTNVYKQRRGVRRVRHEHSTHYDNAVHNGRELQSVTAGTGNTTVNSDGVTLGTNGTMIAFRISVLSDDQLNQVGYLYFNGTTNGTLLQSWADTQPNLTILAAYELGTDGLAAYCGAGTRRVTTSVISASASNSSVVCELCASGTYGLDGNLCVKCPRGGDCTQSGTAMVYPLPGWWRANTDDLATNNKSELVYGFFKCPNTDACLGGQSSPCAERYQQGSPVCGVCNTSAYRRSPSTAYSCIQCTNSWKGPLSAIGWGLLLFTLLLYPWAKVMRASPGRGISSRGSSARYVQSGPSNVPKDVSNPGSNGNGSVLVGVADLHDDSDDSSKQRNGPVHTPPLTPPPKSSAPPPTTAASTSHLGPVSASTARILILVNYLQATSSLGHITSVAWTPEMAGLLKAMNVAAGVSIFSLPGLAITCIKGAGSYYVEYASTMLLLPSVGLLLFIMHSIFAKVMRRRTRKIAVAVGTDEAAGELWDQRIYVSELSHMIVLSRSFQWVAVLLYPAILRGCIEALSCVSLDGVAYLHTDFSIQCYTDIHNAVQATAVACLALLGVGVPFGMWHLLKPRPSTAAPMTMVRKAHTIAASFLTASITPHRWWHALAELARRSLLCAVVVAFGDRQSVAIAMACWISVGSLVCHMRINAYTGFIDDTLQMLSLCATASTAWCGMMLSGTSEYDSVSAAGVSAWLILSNICVCGAILIGIFTAEFPTQAKNAAMRMQKRRKQPQPQVIKVGVTDRDTNVNKERSGARLLPSADKPTARRVSTSQTPMIDRVEAISEDVDNVMHIGASSPVPRRSVVASSIVTSMNNNVGVQYKSPSPCSPISPASTPGGGQQQQAFSPPAIDTTTATYTPVRRMSQMSSPDRNRQSISLSQAPSLLSPTPETASVPSFISQPQESPQRRPSMAMQSPQSPSQQYASPTTAQPRQSLVMQSPIQQSNNSGNMYPSPIGSPAQDSTTPIMSPQPRRSIVQSSPGSPVPLPQSASPRPTGYNPARRGSAASAYT